MVFLCIVDKSNGKRAEFDQVTVMYVHRTDMCNSMFRLMHENSVMHESGGRGEQCGGSKHPYWKRASNKKKLIL